MANSSLFGPGELKINRIRSLAYIKICQPLQFNLILSISTKLIFYILSVYSKFSFQITDEDTYL